MKKHMSNLVQTLFLENIEYKILFAFSFFFCLYVNAQQINALTKSERKDGWKMLFNGKNISDWKSFNGGEVSGWKVVEGVLHNSGAGSDHGGDIITKKEYSNFEFYLEWNISPLSNSGIFIHVQEDVVDAIYKSGPEYQLCDDAGVEKIRERDKNRYTASTYSMYAPENPQLNPIGEWNISRIVVDGSHVEHWLNGKKTLEYELWDEDWKTRKEESKWKDEPYYGIAKKGHIGLQDHGGLTKFRNVKIKEL